MLVGEREREQQVVAEVSADELMKHTATIAAEERLSGNEAEAKAVGYFKQLMEDWGYGHKDPVDRELHLAADQGRSDGAVAGEQGCQLHHPLVLSDYPTGRSGGGACLPARG